MCHPHLKLVDDVHLALLHHIMVPLCLRPPESALDGTPLHKDMIKYMSWCLNLKKCLAN